VRESFADVRRCLQFRSAADAQGMLAAIRQRSEPGTAVVIFLDSDRRPVDAFFITDGGDEVVEVVESVCLLRDHEATCAFLVTDRTGEVPADRIDDELTWMELVALAAVTGVTLLDWFVVWEAKVFSVAEFAPLPAQWTDAVR
jgi:hypothetical protein